MQRQKHTTFLALAVLCATGFMALTWFSPPGQPQPQMAGTHRVVLPATVQTALAAGDRYLAANIETFRAMSSGVETDFQAENLFRIRAYDVASQLNPCHEDNYYVANAILTWGGAPEHGISILERATQCRAWDYSPPFFLGLAQSSFLRNAALARASLELSAQRASTDQRASLQRISIMIEAGSYQETEAALAFLRHEMQLSKDERLRATLARRVARLEGLRILEQAQEKFVEQTGRPLQSPDELLSAGILQVFPEDPMNIGYQLEDGRFRLHSVNEP